MRVEYHSRSFKVVLLGGRMVNADRLLTRLLQGGIGYRQAPVFLGDRVFALTHRRHVIYLVPSDADLTPRILRDGAWEIDVEKTIAKLLRRGDTVVEVGANVGYHTLTMADRVGPKGQVHAFEANPELMGLLNATMYANGFSNWHGIGRVNLYEGAVLDRAGVVTLAFAPGHYASGHVIDGIQPSPAYSKRVEAPAVTLDQVLDDRVAKVDLIRLDIEGSEPLALRGAEALIGRSPTVKIVMEWFVDMMRARVDVEAFVAWLVGLGFKFWTIKPGARLVKMDASMASTAPPCEVLLSRQAV